MNHGYIYPLLLLSVAMSTFGTGSHLKVVLLMYGERGDTAFRRLLKLFAKILDCSKSVQLFDYKNTTVQKQL